MVKESKSTFVFILDGYLALNVKQQKIIEKLLIEKWDKNLDPDVIYNWYPAAGFQAINVPDLRDALTPLQLEVFDSLEEKAFSLMPQLNSLAEQSQHDWARQPIEMFGSCVKLRVDELERIVGLNAKRRAAFEAAGKEAIDEIVRSREILHNRYKDNAAISPMNRYVLQIMMDGPIHQLGSTKAWQAALETNLSGMELSQLEEIHEARKRLCIDATIYAWKFREAFRFSASLKQYQQLDSLLEDATAACFASVKPTNYPISSLHLSRHCLDLRKNEKLKKILTAKQMSRYEKSFRNQDKLQHMQIPLTEETAKQFAETQKPGPPIKFSETEFSVVDQNGKPASDLNIKYTGFYLEMADGRKPLRMNSFYKLPSANTDEGGKCVLKHPASENVTFILASIDDARYKDRVLKVKLADDAEPVIQLRSK